MSGSSNDSSQKSSPQMTPQQMLATYNQYLPSALATTVNQAAPVANVLAGSAAGANPLYTASGLSQLNSYAPGYANAGNNLTQQQSLGAADNLAGAGGLYALEGAGLTNLLNPAQANANNNSQNLVNSINLNGLSGGEQSAVERSLNQSNYATGNLGLDNATNAVSNAMNFGNALQAKRTALGSALNTEQNVASGQNTAFNPVNAAMASGNTSNNFGLSQFNPTQANSNLTAPLSFGSSLGNQVAGVAAAQSSSGSGSGASGGLCCFIFLEATNGVLPWWVRECRDEFYEKEPLVARGYKKMARLLVPMMKKSAMVKLLVNKLMVQPITKYGGWLKNVEGYENCKQYSKFKSFWFAVWKTLGAM